jgi:sugar PTS system EIIA component
MLKNIFKKKEINNAFVSPMSGSVVPLEEVPDQVFSQKMMGDGIAIEPIDETVLSPIDGEVVDVFKTKHAISMRADNGAEILIHMGLETVQLQGEGFDILVSNGQKVKAGEPLAKMNIHTIIEKGCQTVTPIILLNGDEYKISNRTTEKHVTAGNDQLFQINKK